MNIIITIFEHSLYLFFQVTALPTRLSGLVVFYFFLCYDSKDWHNS